MEDDQYKKLRATFSERKNGIDCSPAISGVKHSVEIGVLRRKKKKNNP